MDEMLQIFGIWSRAICSATGDSGGTGGVGGGTGDGDGAGEGEKKEPVTIETVQKLMDQTINKAVTNHLKRFETKIPTADSLKSMFGELLKDFKPAGSGEGGGGGGSGDGGTGGGGGAGAGLTPAELETKKKIAQLEADLKQSNERYAAEQKARSEAETKRMRDEEQSQLESDLRKSGIPELRIAAARALLKERGFVKRVGDDNKILTSIKVNGFDEDVPLSRGIEEWLKSEEGKTFLPAVDASGSGNRGGKPPKPGDKITPAQQSDAIAKWAFGGG